MGTAGFMYWKKSQREMRDQVRGILAEYMPLDDGNVSVGRDGGGSGGGGSGLQLSTTMGMGGTPI